MSSVALSSDPGGDKTYATGDTVTAAVTFDNTVTVDTNGGTPYVPLGIGGNTRNAAYTSIDATNTILSFSYTVVDADGDKNGISIAVNGLSLNGGSIKVRGTEVDALLNHAALPNRSRHRVNKVPGIYNGGVKITSTPQALVDTYGAGETIAFRVNFDSRVIVDTTGGTPRLVMRFGDPDHAGTDRYLQYVRGSGSMVLWFEYTVLAADLDGNGLFMRANQLQANGGTIKHASTGRNFLRNHGRPGQNGDFPSHKVDGGLVVATSRPPNPVNLSAAGQDGQVHLTWDAPPGTVIFTHHEFRYKALSEDEYPETWTQIADSARGDGNEGEFTVTSLTNGVVYDFQVRAVNSVGGSDPSNEASALAGDGLGICNRTGEVHVAILEEIAGVSDCADVTVTHLSQVDSVSIQALSAGLKAGDFAGLSSATSVSVLDSLELTELPDGIFDGLTSLTTISLRRNQIAALQADIFDGLSALQVIQIDDNQLSALPDGIFDSLSALTGLRLLTTNWNFPTEFSPANPR